MTKPIRRSDMDKRDLKVSNEKIDSVPRLLTTIIVGSVVLGYIALWNTAPVITVVLVVLMLSFSGTIAAANLKSGTAMAAELFEGKKVLLWSAALAPSLMTLWAGWLFSTVPSFLNFTAGLSGLLLLLLPVRTLRSITR